MYQLTEKDKALVLKMMKKSVRTCMLVPVVFICLLIYFLFVMINGAFDGNFELFPYYSYIFGAAFVVCMGYVLVNGIYVNMQIVKGDFKTLLLKINESLGNMNIEEIKDGNKRSMTGFSIYLAGDLLDDFSKNGSKVGNAMEVVGGAITIASFISNLIKIEKIACHINKAYQLNYKRESKLKCIIVPVMIFVLASMPIFIQDVMYINTDESYFNDSISHVTELFEDQGYTLDTSYYMVEKDKNIEYIKMDGEISKKVTVQLNNKGELKYLYFELEMPKTYSNEDLVNCINDECKLVEELLKTVPKDKEYDILLSNKCIHEILEKDLRGSYRHNEVCDDKYCKEIDIYQTGDVYVVEYKIYNN